MTQRPAVLLLGPNGPQPRKIAFFFFFNDPATTEIYPFSLPDALPIFVLNEVFHPLNFLWGMSLPIQKFAHDPQRLARAIRLRWITWILLVRHVRVIHKRASRFYHVRSEEHTSELQSQSNLVCRLLLEK